MVVDTHLYDLLGVTPEATERDLKKAFLRKARETHPDKNKDDPQATEKFQAINEAYKILSDPKKRKNYDKYGLDGLKEDQDLDLNDLIMNIFNLDKDQMRPRTKDIVKKVKVTLEEEYNGAEKNVKISRHIQCKECNGKGTKSGKDGIPCETCDGQGRVFMRVKSGRERLVACPDCNGEGEIIEEEDRCPICKGKKYVEEEKDLTVHIERGAEDGDHIVFQGVSDEMPGADTGDVVIVLCEKEHPEFERRFDNLLYRKHITLTEALYGANYVITHLDGRKLVVHSNPEKVIETGEVEIIKNEGMPIKGDSIQKGNLFIEYVVDMPKKEDLPNELKDVLEKVIPAVDETKNIDQKAEDVSVVKTVEGNIRQFKLSKRTKQPRRREAYNEYSDDFDDFDEEEEEEEEEEEYVYGPDVGCNPM